MLIDSFSGGTPNSSIPDYWGGDIYWASPKDFSDEIVLDNTQDRITEEGRKAASLDFAWRGNILLVVRSGILRHTLPVSVAGYRMTVNQDIKVLKLVEEIEPLFFAEYFRVYQARLLPLITKHGTTVQSVNTAELLQLPIPVPPLEVQRALVDEMETARNERRRKLAQADELLQSLDAWLLAQLGIIIPQQNNMKVFATRRGETKKRVDVAFHTPRFQAIRDSIEQGEFPVHSVASFCNSIKSGFAAGKQDQAQKEGDSVPHLRPLNLSISGELMLNGTKYVPRTSLSDHDYCQQGEVLFNNTNSEELVGKSTVFDLNIDCACSNHITRLGITSEASPYFIAAVFNALRSTGYLGMLATNFVNQAGINTETLSTLRIPLPDLPFQQEIVSGIMGRRIKAKRLRQEAETEWQITKRRFEERLLAEQ